MRRSWMSSGAGRTQVSGNRDSIGDTGLAQGDASHVLRWNVGRDHNGAGARDVATDNQGRVREERVEITAVDASGISTMSVR